MSREGFQIPTNLDAAAAGTSQARTATLKYICAECSSKLSLSRTDAVRCKDCGHRILLKARTKRLVQFEAQMNGETENHNGLPGQNNTK
ncbi:CBM_collapsed_G0026640.mRNA.1.CDS.1 [Saccharomyces cerevisiae]|nr:CBM_collapsed_G0026640.mRNA.1.CDS.1 [Saccharomyces cerevisiae]